MSLPPDPLSSRSLSLISLFFPSEILFFLYRLLKLCPQFTCILLLVRLMRPLPYREDTFHTKPADSPFSAGSSILWGNKFSHGLIHALIHDLIHALSCGRTVLIPPFIFCKVLCLMYLLHKLFLLPGQEWIRKSPQFFHFKQYRSVSAHNMGISVTEQTVELLQPVCLPWRQTFFQILSGMFRQQSLPLKMGSS